MTEPKKEFKKIQTKRKSTYALEQIVEAIRQGVYRAGEKLPSERELAEQMEVSRPSVREAISALQLVGILESRPGDGTYVLRDVADLEEEYRARLLLEQSESLEEAFEARRALEESVVRLACRKADPEDLEALGEALARMERAAESQDFDEFTAANQAFHQAIATATHNSLLVRALEPLLEVLRQQIPRKLREKFYEEDSRKFEETYELHRRIYEAIAGRNLSQAVRSIRRHFELLERDLDICE